jgi:hypothetical protein
LNLARMAEALGQVVVALEAVLHDDVLRGDAGGWQQVSQQEALRVSGASADSACGGGRCCCRQAHGL